MAPTVYMNGFKGCSLKAACERTAEFSVPKIPNGCCVLSVTNGDGTGHNEARTFDVYLNGKYVVGDNPTGSRRFASAKVSLAEHNTIKVVILGDTSSVLFVAMNYDPRH